MPCVLDGSQGACSQRKPQHSMGIVEKGCIMSIPEDETHPAAVSGTPLDLLQQDLHRHSASLDAASLDAASINAASLNAVLLDSAVIFRPCVQLEEVTNCITGTQLLDLSTPC